MKIHVNKTALIETLKTALPATNPRSTLPVLAFVHLKAENNLLSISATNLEIGITANTIARVTEPGAVCVPAKMLNDLLSTANGDEISLETEEPRIWVKWGKSRTKLNTLPTDEFPSQPAFCYEGQEIPSAKLKDIVRCLGFSASTEEGRPNLQGIQFDKNEAISTDGFRLSIKKLDMKIKGLIPATSLAMVARLAKDDNICIRSDGENRMIFTGTGWQLMTLLLEGQYPDYHVILPKRTETKINVEISTLKAALMQAQTVSHAYVECTSKSGMLFISTYNDEGAETESEVPVTVEGPEQDFAVNTQYFMQVLNAMSGTLTLAMINGKSPLTFTCSSDPDFTHILMPLTKAR